MLWPRKLTYNRLRLYKGQANKQITINGIRERNWIPRKPNLSLVNPAQNVTSSTLGNHENKGREAITIVGRKDTLTRIILRRNLLASTAINQDIWQEIF